MSDTLRTLLYDAYRMEQNSLDVLSKQATIAYDPDILARIKEHLLETQWQVKLMKACLELQDFDKNFKVEPYNPAKGTYQTTLPALKKFEITFYKKLIAFAQKVNAYEVLCACREIMEQEISMAEWLKNNHSRMEPYLKRDAGFSAVC